MTKYKCPIETCGYYAVREYNLHAHLLGHHGIFKPTCSTNVAINQHAEMLILMRDLRSVIRLIRHAIFIKRRGICRGWGDYECVALLGMRIEKARAIRKRLLELGCANIPQIHFRMRRKTI